MKTKATTEAKLPLSYVLKQLDQRNFDLYRGIKEDDAKRKQLDQMIPYTLPLMMSAGVDEDDHAQLLWRFNRIANPGWWNFRKHPELQLKLLACVGLGEGVRHSFHNPSRSAATSKLLDFLRLRYPDLKPVEMRLWCRRNDEETLRNFVAEYGEQEKEMEAIVGEYRNEVLK